MSGELPKGMKPWDGGEAAPADWDGGRVFYRDHRTGLYPRDKPECWSHKHPSRDDIIAYTPMNPHQKPQEDVVGLIAKLRALSATATPGPWELCQHLKSAEDDAACRCGYRGVVFGPNADAAYAVFQPGHERPRREEEWGTEPARYERTVEIANSHLIVEAVNSLPVLLNAVEQAYEAGRRDMREAAGKVAQDEADDIERHQPSARDSWQQGRAAMAKSIAAAIRNLPTEPLGGEQP